MRSIIFILVGVMTLCCAKSNDSSLFQEANQLYEMNQFEKALAVYKDIEHKSGPVWCNMAHSAYALQDYVQAIICWERAKKYGIVHDDSVKQKISKAYEQLSLVPLMDSPEWLHAYSLLAMQLLFLFVYGLFFLLCMHHFLGRFHGVAFLCVLFGLSTALWYKYEQQTTSIALMVEVGTPLRAGPGEKYHEISRLDSVVYVRTLEKNQDWTKVVYNKNQAWIPTRVIETI